MDGALAALTALRRDAGCVRAILRRGAALAGPWRRAIRVRAASARAARAGAPAGACADPGTSRARRGAAPGSSPPSRECDPRSALSGSAAATDSGAPRTGGAPAGSPAGAPSRGRRARGCGGRPATGATTAFAAGSDRRRAPAPPTRGRARTRGRSALLAEPRSEVLVDEGVRPQLLGGELAV